MEYSRSIYCRAAVGNEREERRESASAIGYTCDPCDTY